MNGWTCSRCEKPQAENVTKTFVPVETEDEIWTTVAVCPACA